MVRGYTAGGFSEKPAEAPTFSFEFNNNEEQQQSQSSFFSFADAPIEDDDKNNTGVPNSSFLREPMKLVSGNSGNSRFPALPDAKVTREKISAVPQDIINNWIAATNTHINFVRNIR